MYESCELAWFHSPSFLMLWLYLEGFKNNCYCVQIKYEMVLKYLFNMCIKICTSINEARTLAV